MTKLINKTDKEPIVLDIDKVEEITKQFTKILVDHENVKHQIQQTISIESSNLSEDKSAVISEIKELQKQENIAQIEIGRWQNKLEELKNKKPKSEILEDIFAVLGFKVINKQHENDCNKSQEYTLQFNNSTSMIILKHLRNEFELLQICPEHPNFAAIRQFLHNTQDVQGFLRNMYVYFTNDSS